MPIRQQRLGEKFDFLRARVPLELKERVVEMAMKRRVTISLFVRETLEW